MTAIIHVYTNIRMRIWQSYGQARCDNSALTNVHIVTASFRNLSFILAANSHSAATAFLSVS